MVPPRLGLPPAERDIALFVLAVGKGLTDRLVEGEKAERRPEPTREPGSSASSSGGALMGRRLRGLTELEAEWDCERLDEDLARWGWSVIVTANSATVARG